MAYSNPYSGTNFFEFFGILFIRLFDFLSGKLSLEHAATDEIQILVLLGVATSASLVGSFLVLRKMTMLANSLSHTILLGIVAAFVMTNDGVLQHSGGIDIHAMLIASLVMGIFTAFLTEFLTKVARLQEDASTGLVFTSLFAIGVILVTLLTRSAHIGIEVVMGNVDALQLDDCKLVFVILILNMAIFALFFKEFKISTFDPAFARALGISTGFFNYLLMVQVSATSIGAFRAVGVLMVLAFITGPPLAARLLVDTLYGMLSYSVAIGCLASLVGVALSRHILTVYDMPLSTGGVVVCTLASFYAFVIIFKEGKRRHLRRKFRAASIKNV